MQFRLSFVWSPVVARDAYLQTCTSTTRSQTLHLTLQHQWNRQRHRCSVVVRNAL